MAKASKATRPSVAGVGISHPDRLIYPNEGISKLQLARYFESVADWMLAHLVGRPLTLLHCPEGLAAPCNYLRHAKAWGPNALRRVRIQEKTKVGEYLVADTVDGLVSLAQMGIVEIHTWNATDDNIDRPNRIILDLDPGPQVTWTQVVTAAKLVRNVLNTLGLESWVKTTGGRGLHVVVPITPERDWSECLAFARDVSQAIARTDPDRYTTTFAKAGREDKLLIDYLRNNRTNTAVAAFSTRARPGAHVSMPVGWRDLAGGPERWTMLTVPARLKRVRTDPWADYWKSKQRLSATAIKALRRL
jgi:bifunctional non-homologous end joining protein LigD